MTPRHFNLPTEVAPMAWPGSPPYPFQLIRSHVGQEPRDHPGGRVTCIAQHQACPSSMGTALALLLAPCVPKLTTPLSGPQFSYL